MTQEAQVTNEETKQKREAVLNGLRDIRTMLTKEKLPLSFEHTQHLLSSLDTAAMEFYKNTNPESVPDLQEKGA